MLAFCPNCWSEITSSPSACRTCGTNVDVDSPDYEKQLLELIPQSHAAKRAEICLLLGQRKNRNVVSRLVSLLHADPETLERDAAHRALSEIGGASALLEITKVADNEASPVCAVARQVLRTLKARAGNS